MKCRKLHLSLLSFLLSFLVSVSCAQVIDEVDIDISSNPVSVFLTCTGPELTLQNVEVLDDGIPNGEVQVWVYFIGCPINQLIVEHEVDFEIDVEFPFDLSIYTVWNTEESCPFPTEPMLVDSLILDSNQIIEMGVNANDHQVVGAYPNPVSGSFINLQIPQSNFPLEFKLISADHRLVKSETIYSPLVDLSDVESGVYTARLVGTSRHYAVRLVKL